MLQTLPRFADTTTLAVTIYSGRALRMGVSPHTRALAARQLHKAVAGGRVSAEAALQAMREGDLAVAALLRPTTAILPMPRLNERSLAGLPSGGALPQTLMAQLLGLVRALVRDGDIHIEQVRAITVSAPDPVKLLELIQGGWDRRCARLADILAPVRAGETYTCYSITLTPILAAIEALSNGRQTELARFEDTDPDSHGAVVALEDVPLVQLPAHPVDEPEFFRAFIGVWQAIANACGEPRLMYGIDKDLSTMGGSLVEAFQDAIVTARWSDGLPILTQAAREGLESEYGIEEPENLGRELARYRQWCEAVPVAATSPDSSAFRRFVAQRATPGQAALLEALRGLLKRLRAYRRAPAPVAMECDVVGDGVIEVALVPCDYGIDDYIQPMLECMYESGDTPMLRLIGPAGQDTDELLRRADQAAVAAITATACLNEVGDFVHKQRQAEKRSNKR